MTMPGLATSTMSGIASGGIHAVPVACLDAGPQTLRPGLCKRTPAASDSSQCLDALRWCGAGMAWNASEADSVRQHVNERVRLAGAPPGSFSQEEAARMLLRARAGSETAPEVTAVPFPPKLYMDPVLRSRRGVLVRFLRRFRALFFVRKKGDKQRMIIDARAVNDRFRTPPAMQMTSLEGLSGLEARNIDGLYVASDDSDNRLRVSREFSEWFALEPVTEGELGLSHLDGELLERSTINWPCCATLPLGFSWSACLAQ